MKKILSVFRNIITRKKTKPQQQSSVDYVCRRHDRIVKLISAGMTVEQAEIVQDQLDDVIRTLN